MKNLLRMGLSFLTFVAVYYFSFWVGGSALISVGVPLWVSTILALVVAILTTRFVWIKTTSLGDGLATHVVLGAVITGAIAFSAGFFGPIIFTPEANQGPLLGLFITGPLGFIVGAVGGAIYWFFRQKRAAASAAPR